MFKCEECGHLFEEGEEKVIVEPSGERYTVCPRCKGLYEEIKPCKICGSYEEMQCGETFCDNCKIEVQKTFKQLMDKYFTVPQRELLNEIYDGEEL